MTAPVASGWSVRRVGLAPTGKAPRFTAHATSGRSSPSGVASNQAAGISPVFRYVYAANRHATVDRGDKSRWFGEDFLGEGGRRGERAP
jgi:hypothetical protein